MTTIAPIASAEHLDLKRYIRLLGKFAPKVIETEEENTAALAIVEQLMAKGDDHRTAEEDAILDLLSGLIEQFEEKAYPIPDADPREVLAVLMEGRNLKPVDLASVIGSRSKVSEILSGKRSISKEQAKKLGEFFHISPAVFI